MPSINGQRRPEAPIKEDNDVGLHFYASTLLKRSPSAEKVFFFFI